MKKKIILSSILALGVLGGVVGLAHGPIKAKAYDHAANAKLYFVKPSGWTYVSMFIGHNTYSIDYKMTKVANTNDLYYLNVPSWGGWTGWCFADINGWGNDSNNPNINNRINYCTNTKLETSYTLNANEYYLFVPQSGSDNAVADGHWRGKDDGYAHMNNLVSVSLNDENAGTVTLNGYSFTAAASVSAVSNTSSSAASINAGCYTTVNMSVTVNDGYEFAGWYTSEDSETPVSTELTYSSNITLEGVTLHAKFNSTAPAIPTVTELFTKYYNGGSYVKETVLNTNEFADEDVKNYFHAGAQVKYRQTTYAPGELSMVTKATSEAEWGTHTSTYRDNDNGGVDHLTNGVKDYSVSGTVNGQDRSSVENWYVTLHDFVKTELTGWEYADGVYTLSLVDNELATKMAREFVAPMWLETEEAKNYVQFDKLTVEEVGESLVMKLYVDSTNSGQLVEGANLVFSQATITK